MDFKSTLAVVVLVSIVQAQPDYEGADSEFREGRGGMGLLQPLPFIGGGIGRSLYYRPRYIPRRIPYPRSFAPLPYDDLFDDFPFDDIYDDYPFDDIFDDGPFDDIFDDGPFDDIFDDGPFDDIFDDGPFDDLYDDLFDDDYYPYPFPPYFGRRRPRYLRFGSRYFRRGVYGIGYGRRMLGGYVPGIGTPGYPLYGGYRTGMGRTMMGGYFPGSMYNGYRRGMLGGGYYTRTPGYLGTRGAMVGGRLNTGLYSNFGYRPPRRFGSMRYRGFRRPYSFYPGRGKMKSKSYHNKDYYKHGKSYYKPGKY